MIEKSCCFTGHRMIPTEYRKNISEQLRRYISILAENGITKFIAGGALGFDTLAALEVIELKNTVYPELELVLALPCRDQKKFWQNSDKAEYDRIVSNATDVVYLSEKYTRYCMHVRNKYMVDNSDYCIAYLIKDTGGTASTVDYAKKKGKNIIYIT